MVVPADLTMFTPLKSALLTTLVIWSRSDLKSAFRAWRLVVSSEVSEAARTLAFIWVSRSETCWPADMATSMVDWARFRLSFTESRAVTLPVIVWAIDHTAPLSLAELMVLPVEITLWVCCSDDWVEARLARAARADAFVLMLLSAIEQSSFSKDFPAVRAGSGEFPHGLRSLPARSWTKADALPYASSTSMPHESRRRDESAFTT